MWNYVGVGGGNRSDLQCGASASTPRSLRSSLSAPPDACCGAAYRDLVAAAAHATPLQHPEAMMRVLALDGARAMVAASTVAGTELGKDERLGSESELARKVELGIHLGLGQWSPSQVTNAMRPEFKPQPVSVSVNEVERLEHGGGHHPPHPRGVDLEGGRQREWRLRRAHEALDAELPSRDERRVRGERGRREKQKLLKELVVVTAAGAGSTAVRNERSSRTGSGSSQGREDGERDNQRRWKGKGAHEAKEKRATDAKSRSTASKGVDRERDRYEGKDGMTRAEGKKEKEEKKEKDALDCEGGTHESSNTRKTRDKDRNSASRDTSSVGGGGGGGATVTAVGDGCAGAGAGGTARERKWMEKRETWRMQRM